MAQKSKKILYTITCVFSSTQQTNQNPSEFFQVKLLQLAPEWDITAEKANRAMIQKVVKYCVETLKHEFNPGLVVLKMQVYFNSAFSLSDEAIENNRTNLYERLTPLANEILKIRSISTEHEYMKFYRNVVYYVTLFSGLGNPAMQPVIS